MLFVMLKSLFMGLVAIPVLSSTCVNLKINSPSKIVDRSKNQFVVTDSLRENTRRDLFDDYKLKKKTSMNRINGEAGGVLNIIFISGLKNIMKKLVYFQLNMRL